MLTSTSEIIKYCQEEGISFPEMVLRDEVEKFETDPKEILEELGRMLDVMEESTQNYLDHPSDLGLGMINGFAYKMMGYRDQDSWWGRTWSKPWPWPCPPLKPIPPWVGLWQRLQLGLLGSCRRP